jgi:hypothetical protein
MSHIFGLWEVTKKCSHVAATSSIENTISVPHTSKINHQNEHNVKIMHQFYGNPT